MLLQCMSRLATLDVILPLLITIPPFFLKFFGLGFQPFVDPYPQTEARRLL